MVDKFVTEHHFSDFFYRTSKKLHFSYVSASLTAVAGFRTVVLKSKDGGEERNEEEEQSDEDGVLLSEVIIIEVIIIE